METSFVAECFWPDVSEADLDALDRRVAQALAPDVRYLGSILLREDEVVLCQLDGPADSVRAVAERAQVPFERILHAARSPWSRPVSPLGPQPCCGRPPRACGGTPLRG